MVGHRAGPEPAKCCSPREVTQSTAWHVCDTGALDRDESSYWKLVKEKPWRRAVILPQGCVSLRKEMSSPGDPIRTDNIQMAHHCVSQRTKASAATTTKKKCGLQLSFPHRHPHSSLCSLTFLLLVLWLPSAFLLLEEVLVTLVSFRLRSEP